MITHEMLQRLPKWAQEHIATLARERNDAIKTLQDFLDNQTPSDFWTEEWRSTKNVKNYIQSRQVTIKMGDRKEVYVLKRQDGTLDVSSGFGGLRIEPSASNSIRILVKD